MCALTGWVAQFLKKSLSNENHKANYFHFLDNGSATITAEI